MLVYFCGRLADISPKGGLDGFHVAVKHGIVEINVRQPSETGRNRSCGTGEVDMTRYKRKQTP